MISRVRGEKAAASSSRSSCQAPARSRRRAQRYVDGDAARHDHRGRVAVVKRLDEDHLVARFDQGLDGGEDAFGGPVGDDDLGHGVQITAKERAVDGGNRLDEARMTGAACILVEVGGDGLLCGVLDEVRRSKIREALAQVDSARLDGKGSELGEDRGAKAGHALCGPEVGDGRRWMAGHGLHYSPSGAKTLRLNPNHKGKLLIRGLRRHLPTALGREVYTCSLKSRRIAAGNIGLEPRSLAVDALTVDLQRRPLPAGTNRSCCPLRPPADAIPPVPPTKQTPRSTDLRSRCNIRVVVSPAQPHPPAV